MTEEMAKKTSEFGKGMCYCIGLFLAHEQMYHARKHEFEKLAKETGHDYLLKTNPQMWFNGSSDHLYELQIDKKLPKSLKNRIKKFKDKCLDFGHGSFIWQNEEKVTEKDVLWAIEEARTLLRLIDKAHGIETVKGEYE